MGMKTLNNAMVEMWEHTLELDGVYDLDDLMERVYHAFPRWRRQHDRHVLRTRIAEQTRIWRGKSSQYCQVFEKLDEYEGDTRRRFVGLPRRPPPGGLL